MPPQSHGRKPVISARGKQLASATVLAVLVVLLLVGTVALGLYELHANGVSTWIHAH